MNIISEFTFNFGEQTKTYFKLLEEEDFDFKTKDINFYFNLDSDKINVKIDAKSILELKIGTTALIKTLEVIEKTLNL
jgi:hypothetical protein